jgi:hypothetical protein
LSGTLALLAHGKLTLVDVPDPPNPLPAVQGILWGPSGYVPLLGALIAVAAITVGIVRKGARGFLPEILLCFSALVFSAIFFAVNEATVGNDNYRHALPAQVVLAVLVWVLVLRAFTGPRPAEDASHH